MSRAEIIEAAARFRAQLVAGNNAALREMIRIYGITYQRLYERWRFVTDQIQRLRERGLTPSLGLLQSEARYNDLLQQTQDELNRFSMQAAEIVRQQQEFGIQSARQDAQAMTMISLGPRPRRVRYQVKWNRIHTVAVENMVGFLAGGSPLAYKFAGMSEDVVTGIRSTLAFGMAAGQNPRHIARSIRSLFTGHLSNVLTVCRTECIRVYRLASHENYAANSHIVRGWIWCCARNARTCAACWGMDGSFHTLNETLNDHPNGRCVAIPVTRSWSELESGVDTGSMSIAPWNPETYFRGLSEEEQQKILGPRKYEMWTAGKIKLADIPSITRSHVWGDGVRIGTISEIMDRASRRA